MRHFGFYGCHGPLQFLRWIRYCYANVTLKGVITLSKYVGDVGC